MIESIQFSDFRVLERAGLPLRALTLLLGPNGSGKTTALRALLALGHAARAQVAGETLPLIEDLAGATAKFLFTGAMGGAQVTLAFNSAGAASLKISSPAKPLSEVLTWIAGTRGYVLDPAALARPGGESAAHASLASDGAGLAAVLAWMRHHDGARWAAFVDEFRRVMPEFSDVVAGRTTSEEISFSVVTAQGKSLAPGNLSQGTLVMLGLLSIAFAEPRPTLVCFEELERGIHPRLLRDMRDMLYRLSFPAENGIDAAPVQVIATTHSPYVLDLFAETPEDVVIATKDNEAATFMRLDTIPELKEMLEEGRLGDLWYSGVLGGVP